MNPKDFYRLSDAEEVTAEEVEVDEDKRNTLINPLSYYNGDEQSQHVSLNAPTIGTCLAVNFIPGLKKQNNIQTRTLNTNTPVSYIENL